MSHTAGIDIGSITAKAAIMRDDQLLGSRVIFTGYNSEAAGRRVYEELLGELGLDRAEVVRIVATAGGQERAQRPVQGHVDAVSGCGAQHGAVPSVVLDNYRAGELAAEHLVSLGHKHIVCITGPLNITLCRERVKGFKQVLLDHQIEFEEHAIFEGDFNEDQEITRRRPDSFSPVI
jgi:hypothetical protein